MAQRVKRPELLNLLEVRFRSNPVVLLLGPRQCGKTTIAREFGAVHKAEYFDLEAPSDRSRLDQPMTALEPLRGWVVIDEAQLKPELFPILRLPASLTDKANSPRMDFLERRLRFGAAFLLLLRSSHRIERATAGNQGQDSPCPQKQGESGTPHSSINLADYHQWREVE